MGETKMFKKIMKKIFRKSINEEQVLEVLESDIAHDYLHKPDYDPIDPCNTRKAKREADL